MTDIQPKFWWSLLRDDAGDFCVCRILLLLSPLLLGLTIFLYCFYFKNSAADTNMWDFLIATSGGTLPMIGYVFNRGWESKEWIAEVAKGFKK